MHLTLYGNVDFRQASLAFNGSRAHRREFSSRKAISSKRARFWPASIPAGSSPQVGQADATVAAQRAMVMNLRNGSRPEEIAQARANLASAKADAANANIQYERRAALTATATISKQDLDTAKAAAGSCRRQGRSGAERA